MKKLIKNITKKLKPTIFSFVLIFLGVLSSNDQFIGNQSSGDSFSIFDHTDTDKGTKYNYLLSSNTLQVSSFRSPISSENGQIVTRGVLNAEAIWGSGSTLTLSVDITDTSGNNHSASLTEDITPLVPNKHSNH